MIENKKRGQVTIFVVLGLVLVIIVGLFLYINNSSKTETPVEQQIDFSYEQSLVKSHVEFCVYKITEEGLRKLGASGGYIYPEEFGFVALDDFPTSGNALAFAPGSDYIIPYWQYLKSSNSCTDDCYFDSGKPPIKYSKGVRSVEYQLSKYVTDNLEKCVDLDQYKQFGIEVLAPPAATVTVGGSSIVSNVHYPIIITSIDGVEKELNNYEASLDIDLNNFFELAETLIKNKNYAGITTEIITIYGLDESIPPIAGEPRLDFGAPKFWLNSDVAEKLKGPLAENIGNLQIVGARDSVNFYAQEYNNLSYFTSIYSHYQTPLKEFDVSNLEDVKIDFIYLPWWNPYVHVTPGSGELIMEEPFINLFVLQFMFSLNAFTYDVSYPMVITLEDTESLNGEGFTFTFAFEVNVRDNEPFVLSEPTEAELLAQSFIPDRDLFFEPSNWNSGDVVVQTINPYDNSSVEDVTVSFTCTAQELFMGVSKIDETGVANVNSNLPVCLGAEISGFKPDYFIPTLTGNTPAGVNQTIILPVEPSKTLNVTFVEKIVGKEIQDDETVWAFRPSSNRDVADDSKIIIIFTRMGSSGEEEFIKHFTYYGNQTTIPSIDLVTGSYTVQAFLFQNGVVIPEHEIDDQVIPRMEFNDSFYGGGLLLDNSTIGYFNVDYDDLKNSKDLVINLLAFDIPDFTYFEDLGQIGEIDNYVVANSEYFWPEFK